MVVRQVDGTDKREAEDELSVLGESKCGEHQTNMEGQGYKRLKV